MIESDINYIYDFFQKLQGFRNKSAVAFDFFVFSL